MFKNYLKIALRNFLRQKTYAFINMAGLGIGMACCILLLLFVQDELSFDRFHQNADRIYRIVRESKYEDYIDHFAHTPAPLAPALMRDFPEVVNAVRFAYRQRQLVTYQNKQFWEERFMLADPSIFEIFTFPLLKGNPKTALQNLYSIVITEDMAKKYFGEEEPIGKRLRVGSYQTKDYVVTGVLKNIPGNSQLQFDFLASFQHQKANISWWASNYTTFILLPNGDSAADLEGKFPDFIGKYLGEGDKNRIKFHLQPLTEIHLHSKLRSDLPTNRDISHIYIFSGIAFIILLIACINYMNLATARYAGRAKEVGMRKVVGAQRAQLIVQFIGESILLSFIALVLALILVEVFLPTFNQLANKNLQFKYFANLSTLAGLAGITLFVGLVAGSYPALFLSASKPISILKSGSQAGEYRTSTFIRKGLVVAQFSFSIIFIFCIMVVYNQLSYIRNKNLGYDKDHIVVMPIYFSEMQSKYPIFKNEIVQNSSVSGATATAYLPSKQGYNQNAWWEGLPDDEFSNMMRWIPADRDFIETLGMEIVAGRTFSLPQGGLVEVEDEYILNESAVKHLGWRNPIGKQFKIIKKGTVVGVVKDFHFRSLHHEIEPLVLYNFHKIYHYLLVKIQPTEISSTLAFLKQKWQSIAPGQPFQYFFLDEDFDRIYKSETRLSNIFGYIAGVTILIACLGLLGLSSFAAERRTKEIGIRKVLGASVLNIILLLSQDFSKWVIVANIIAGPIAYFSMNKWLQNFAYHTSIGTELFILAGIATLMIAIVTVSYQAIKAALTNPVEALRYE